MACANQDVATMQTAANRFGTHMFSDAKAIAVDCSVGPNTWDLAMSSLVEITPGTTDQVDDATQAAAQILYDSINSYSDLTNAASDVANLLNNASDQLGFGAAPQPPVIQPPRSGLKTNRPGGLPPGFRAKTAATSLFGLGLPAPVVYIAGAALGIGITALVVARLKKR
jgi:hypothetical protein